MISDSADAVVVALLFPAMARGEDIEVESAISEDLYYHLNKSVQVILKSVFPGLHEIQINPRELTAPQQKSPGVATGFSGGIDSFCVLADHYYSDDVPGGFRLTHLLFNNVGSHGAGGEALFNTRFSRVKSMAEQIGLPILAVNSNLDSFYIDLGYDFIDTHTPRNVSVAHLLKNGIGRYYYASTYDYRSTAVGTSKGGLPQCEPVLLPLLSTGSMDIISAGSEYTRVEKTLKVAAIEDSHDLLDICVKAKQAEKVDAINCSTCWKCMRTLLTLDIAGLLDSYDQMFDLELYRARRDKYIAEIYNKDDPLTTEIIQFAKQQNFSLPFSSKFYAYTGLYNVFPYYERVVNLRRKISREGIGYLFKKLKKEKLSKER